MTTIRFALERNLNFWYLDPIVLNEKNKKSPPLSLENLTKDHIDALNKAIENREIYLIDNKDNRVHGLIEELSEFECFEINYEEEEKSSDNDFEVFSATVDLDEEEKEEEKEVSPDEQDFEAAEFLLSKNGNTVKKSILSLSVDNPEHKMLLIACKEIESSNKKRKSILSAIENILFN